MNDCGTDGVRDDLHRCVNARTAEGAHLLFGLFLVAADLQVILQHSARREKGRVLLQTATSCLRL